MELILFSFRMLLFPFLGDIVAFIMQEKVLILGRGVAKVFKEKGS